MALELTSSAFVSNGPIPRQHTCEGSDLSPALAWHGAPAMTVSFALIADDPDAPGGIWVHWVIYNIPASSRCLPEGVTSSEFLSGGSTQGINDGRDIGYCGPCPPPGKPHHYFFKLYALYVMLDIKGTATKDKLLLAIKGHVLAEASLVGTYQR